MHEDLLFVNEFIFFKLGNDGVSIVRQIKSETELTAHLVEEYVGGQLRHSEELKFSQALL